MSMCRRFNGAPVVRLIVSVPAEMVAAVDRLLAAHPRHAARGCRAEFVRLAVADRLALDLMISAAPKGDGSRGGVSPETPSSINHIGHVHVPELPEENSRFQGLSSTRARGGFAA